jgi:hypothetical protein
MKRFPALLISLSAAILSAPMLHATSTTSVCTGNLNNCQNPYAQQVVRIGTVGLADAVAARRRQEWNEDAARERFRAFAAAGTPAPAYRLAFPLSGTGMTEAAGSAMDASGNIYLTGGFAGTITFPTNPVTTASATGDIDMFVAKFSPTGQCLWARVGHSPGGLLPGLSLGAGLSIVAGSAGEAYVGGGFVRSLTFQDGPNVIATVNGAGPGYNFEAFLAKYDANGTLLWARGGGSGATQDAEDLNSGTNGITNIAINSQGSVFAGGTFNGYALLGYTVSLPNIDAAFIAQIDPATGVPAWVNVTDSDGFDGIQDIAPDSHGGVYALLWSGGTVMEFPTASAPTVIHFDPNSVDSFLALYTSSGICQWARQPGTAPGSTILIALGLGVSPQSEPYVTGQASGGVLFDSLTLPGLTVDMTETFLVKYTPLGAAAWTRSFFSTDYSYAQRVTVDGAGFAYVVGGYFGQTSMNGNFNTPGMTLTAGGDEDLFLAQWDYAGTPRWIRPLSSPGRANTGYLGGAAAKVHVESARLVYDSYGKNILVTGDFAGTMMLDTNVSVTAGGSAQSSYAALLPSGDATTTNGDPALRFQVTTQGWSGSNYYVDLAVTDTGAGTGVGASLTSARATGLTGIAIGAPAFPVALGDIPPTGTRIQRLYISGLNPAAANRFVLAVNASSTRQSDGKPFTAAFSTLISAAASGN